jgi:hypothetical protein
MEVFVVARQMMPYFSSVQFIGDFGAMHAGVVDDDL